MKIDTLLINVKCLLQIGKIQEAKNMVEKLMKNINNLGPDMVAAIKMIYG